MSFSFAVTAPSPRLPVADWVEDLRRLEAIGFDEVVIADHFTDGYDTEPMVGLTAAAMATERLRLRPAVLGVDYRHPVLVHRMAATLGESAEAARLRAEAVEKALRIGPPLRVKPTKRPG